MSTRAQRTANRRNAQVSTGPVTAPNDEYQDLFERTAKEMEPGTEHEWFMVGLMAQARWKCSRIQVYESDLLDRLIAGEPVEAKLTLMIRYAASAQRAYHKAHREFTQNRRQSDKDEQAAANHALDLWARAPIGSVPSLEATFPALRDSASFGKTNAATALRL